MVEEDLGTLELRAMRSAWAGLERRWALTARELAELVPGGTEHDPSTRDAETRMRIMIEIGYRIGYSGDELLQWLRTASPVLGWLTPIEVMSGTLADLRGLRRIVEQGFAS